MKKTLCLLLALSLLCTFMAGCGQAAAPKEAATTPLPETEVENSKLPDAEKVNESIAIPEDFEAPEDVETPKDAETPAEEEQNAEETGADPELADGSVLENVSFVLIYDPLIYNENDEEQINSTTLSSGDMSRQIITGENRGKELAPLFEGLPSMISQKELDDMFHFNEFSPLIGMTGKPDPVYQVGSTHSFFCFDPPVKKRLKRDFTCVYSGEYCYIWSVEDSIDQETAAAVGKEFDEKIYQKDIQYFGIPRFTENGGKVNILFYPMEGDCYGLFCRADIFSSSEFSDAFAEFKTLNTDHAIIALNSDKLENELPTVYATLAHELQHQICASDSQYYEMAPYVQSWLNEAMSACAEELCYPGIKKACYCNLYMYFSDNFRTGQSLYNFENENDEFIGAYGAVYLFQKYLSEHAGEDVFSKIHTYWREANRANVTEAEAICASVPAEFLAELDAKYSYPESVSARFASKEEEWMSKMTLDFYLEILSPEFGELGDYADYAMLAMLYLKVNPLEIEGGGRVIVAIDGNSFSIPEDAGEGLIFVGLDNDFNVVTGLYSNAK